jgi:hypothetical protein
VLPFFIKRIVGRTIPVPRLALRMGYLGRPVGLDREGEAVDHKPPQKLVTKL